MQKSTVYIHELAIEPLCLFLCSTHGHPWSSVVIRGHFRGHPWSPVVTCVYFQTQSSALLGSWDLPYLTWNWNWMIIELVSCNLAKVTQTNWRILLNTILISENKIPITWTRNAVAFSSLLWLPCAVSPSVTWRRICTRPNSMLCSISTRFFTIPPLWPIRKSTVNC